MLWETEQRKYCQDFTDDELYTMMTLWSIFRSPLMIGGEMTKFDDFTLSILTNEAILGMHKNARHAHEVYRRKRKDSETILWAAAHAEKTGTYAALFNAGEEDGIVTLDFAELELDGMKTVTNLWTGEITCADGEIAFDIPKHGAVALWIE